MTPGSFEVLGRPTLTAAARLLESAGLPASDLTNGMLENFLFIVPRDAPIGLVGLEVLGDCALLRSLVVAPGMRSRGAGTVLVDGAERHARSKAVRELFLLTTTAEGFFARRGYAAISRDEAPEAIRSTREFSEFCPRSSALMRKVLA